MRIYASGPEFSQLIEIIWTRRLVRDSLCVPLILGNLRRIPFVGPDHPQRPETVTTDDTDPQRRPRVMGNSLFTLSLLQSLLGERRAVLDYCPLMAEQRQRRVVNPFGELVRELQAYVRG